MRSWQVLPWRSLLQVAILTNLTVIPLELILDFGYKHSPAISQTITFLYTPPLGLITPIIIAIGLGALAVYFLEQFYQHVRINTSTLWALIPCLIIIILLKLFLPLPSVLADFRETQLIGIVVGVFWKGRYYWRY